MTDLFGAILAAVFVLVLSWAFWSSNIIISILLLVIGGALILKNTK